MQSGRGKGVTRCRRLPRRVAYKKHVGAVSFTSFLNSKKIYKITQDFILLSFDRLRRIGRM